MHAKRVDKPDKGRNTEVGFRGGESRYTVKTRSRRMALIGGRTSGDVVEIR